MSHHPDYLTATDFYRLFQCPHWPYFDRFATPEERKLKRAMTPQEENRLEHGLAHERDVVQKLMAEHPVTDAPVTRDAEKDFEATFKLMQEGVPLIYQGTLTFGDWTGRPDLLERREGTSKLGEWFYAPVDVKSTHAIEKYQKFQLTFYAKLLELTQGRFPGEAAIINRDGQRLSFSVSEYVREFEEVLAELERIRAGERPDPVLRKSCFDTGPWGEACQALARSTDDIALLYNVDVRKLRALRGLGIRTVADAAEMDPTALDGVAPGLRLHGLEVAKLQAQSLKNNWVLVREAAVFPTSGLEIHFDIESDPPNDVDYLYGFLIRGKDGDEYRPFVAETLDGEKKMWQDFLAWVATLPTDYTVYHYSAYEAARLDVLEKRHGTGPGLDAFRERMVDLKDLVTASVIFPLYFYGLKYIAPFLGYRWIGDVKGGSQSVDVFETFLETRDRALLDSIIVYNECDVRATAHLKDWMATYARTLTAYERPYPWES